jgi:hypothetical protein
MKETTKNDRQNPVYEIFKIDAGDIRNNLHQMVEKELEEGHEQFS